jgi:hypothetical protein
MAFTLRFIRPPANSLGELRTSGDCPLSMRELEEIAAEVRAEYAVLASGEKRLLEPKTRLASLPSGVRFRVEVEPGIDHRSPTLVLRYGVQVPEAGAVMEAQPSWPRDLTEELQRLMQMRPLSELLGPERAALSYALAELSQVAGSSAPTLAVLLLAGYLTLAEQSGKLAGDALRSSLYALAARGLERVLPGSRGVRAARSEDEAAFVEGTTVARYLAGLLNLLPRRFMERAEPASMSAAP